MSWRFSRSSGSSPNPTSNWVALSLYVCCASRMRVSCWSLDSGLCSRWAMNMPPNKSVCCADPPRARPMSDRRTNHLLVRVFSMILFSHFLFIVESCWDWKKYMHVHWDRATGAKKTYVSRSMAQKSSSQLTESLLTKDSHADDSDGVDVSLVSMTSTGDPSASVSPPWSRVRLSRLEVCYLVWTLNFESASLSSIICNCAVIVLQTLTSAKHAYICMPI